MAQQVINVGTAPNDGTGDPLRTAYIKTNDNFGELYNRVQTTPPVSLIGSVGDTAGMYAYDANYFYYCYADFDGTTQIWNQITNTGNVSVTSIASGNSSIGFNNINGNAAISVRGVSNIAVFSNTAVNIAGSVSATGNITGGNLNTVSIYASGLVSAAGTVTGNFFVGNGAFLTGITTTYGNSNVATYLPTYTGGFANLLGNITTTANVQGVYILGNGSQLTGLPSTYANSNVSTYLAGSAGNIIPAANVTYSLGSSAYQWKDLWVSNSTIYINSVAVSINSSNTLTVAGQAVLTNGGNTAVSTTGNVSAANIAATGAVTGSSSSISGNVTGGNVLTAGVVSAAGNITGNYILGNGSLLTGIAANYGNANVAAYLPTYTGSFASLTGNVTTTANVSAGNILFSRALGTTVSATGNITGSYLFGNGSSITGLPANYGNANVANYLPTYNGYLTGGNLSTTGNISGYNINSAGFITAQGNITGSNLVGSYIYGNGSQLTGITASVSGTVTSGNVSYLAPFTSAVSRTGNSKWSDMVNVKDFGAVGNGIADDRGPVQAAINTGKHVYIPAGTYRLGTYLSFGTKGQMFTGDGRGVSTFLVDNVNYTPFSLSNAGVFIFSTSEPGPQIENIGIQFIQPVTSNRASLINYPPAIYAQNTPRFQLNNCRIVQAMSGIDMRQNCGGATIDGLEMSCYNYGVKIDGSLDTVRIMKLQYWPFDIAGTANESIFYDSTNRGVVSGRCDDLKINGCLFINGGIQVELQSTAAGTTFGTITDTDFDSSAALSMAGGNMNIVACYFTVGNAAYVPITQTGGYLRVESCEFEAAVATTSPMIVQSGESFFQMTNCMLRNSGVPSGFFYMSAGTASISNCIFIAPPNQAWTNALVTVAGGRITFVGNRASDKGTGAGNFIRIVSDNWNSICDNLGIGWGYAYPGSYTTMVVANNK